MIHSGSGNEIETDAPKDNNGKGEAFSPTDLTAVSLASCMVTVMGIYMKKNGYLEPRIHGIVEKKMNSSPRRIARIEVQLLVEIHEKDFSEDLKSSLQKVAEDCPVALSLHPETKQLLKLEFKTYLA